MENTCPVAVGLNRQLAAGKYRLVVGTLRPRLLVYVFQNIPAYVFGYIAAGVGSNFFV